jgi:hypothetical protein
VTIVFHFFFGTIKDGNYGRVVWRQGENIEARVHVHKTTVCVRAEPYTAMGERIEEVEGPPVHTSGRPIRWTVSPINV